MTAVSPRNPNLCLSCEQLLEDESTELDRLLTAGEYPESTSQPVLDPAFFHGAYASSPAGREPPPFIAPA